MISSGEAAIISFYLEDVELIDGSACVMLRHDLEDVVLIDGSECVKNEFIYFNIIIIIIKNGWQCKFGR